MDDAAKARPLSGEIMTSVRGAAHPAPWGDGCRAPATDADFETIPATPSPCRFREPVTSLPEGMNLLRSSGPRRQERKSGGMIFLSIGLLFALTAFWLSGGRLLPHHVPANAAAPPDAGPRMTAGAVPTMSPEKGHPLATGASTRNTVKPAAPEALLAVDVKTSGGAPGYYVVEPGVSRLSSKDSFVFSGGPETDWDDPVSSPPLSTRN